MTNKIDHIDDDDIECHPEIELITPEASEECQIEAEYVTTQKRSEQLLKKVLRKQ
jgi:hypothetical protein